MTKRIIGVLLLAAAASFAFAEDGGPASFDVFSLDASKLDVAGAHFSFAAPCRFYVTGVVYDGVVYSAFLEYDGAQTLKVLEAGKGPADPFSSLDLSHAFLVGDKGAVVLRNAIIDGYAYTLDVIQVAKAPAALTLAQLAVSDAPVASVPLKAASGAPAAASTAEVDALKTALAAKEDRLLIEHDTVRNIAYKRCCRLVLVQGKVEVDV